MSRRATFTAERQCEHCATPFALSNPNQRFCCEDCRLRHHFGPPRPCTSCQVVFQPRWKANQYCSVACHDLAQRRSPDLVCEHCGRTFRRPDTLSNSYQPRFCCWDCRVAHSVVDARCQQCDGPLPQLPPSVLRGRTFCSVRCRADSRRSPAPRRKHGYDARYDAWRAAVLERDKICRHCGASEKLQAHHIRGWTAFPDLRYDLDNGLLLCVDCHQLRHSGHGVGGRPRTRPPATCVVCGAPISGRGSSGCCSAHYMLFNRPAQTVWQLHRSRGVTCRTCGVPVVNGNVSGFCKAHMGPYISQAKKRGPS